MAEATDRKATILQKAEKAAIHIHHIAENKKEAHKIIKLLLILTED